MSEITTDGTDFRGRTSPLPWRATHDPLECRRCGSSLARRRTGVRRQTTRGIQLVIETFKCRCGTRRRIKREVTAM